MPIYRITAPLIEYCKKLQNVKNHFWEVEAAGSNPVTPTIANCPPNGLLSCLAGIFIFVFADV